MQGIPSGFMGQEQEWVRSARCDTSACAELLDEGDGNLLLRSSFNRDRTLRLSATEMDQVVSMWMDEGVRPAPAVVS